MKRSPLNRGDKPLRRTVWMTQSGPTREQHPERTPQRRTGSKRVDTGPDHMVRALVASRDDGRCLVCGAAAESIDHRRNRGMGNGNRAKANVPSNLASLCGSGTTGCHGMITNPTAFGVSYLETLSNGWNVSTNANVDTETIAYLCHDGWFYLLDDGTRQPCEPTGFEAEAEPGSA